MPERVSGRPEREPGLSRLLVIAAGVVVVWATSAVVISRAFPTWETRGQVGDTFGAVNALFSGLALAGIVYAILLQRGELRLQRAELEQTRKTVRAQLREMQMARRLQAQPLVLPEDGFVEVERPRPFYTPPEDEYSANSRFVLRVALANPSEYPAIGVHLSARLWLPGERASDNSIESGDGFVDVLPPGRKPAEGDDAVRGFMFLPETLELIGALARPNTPRVWPLVGVEALFRNLLGGHFRSRQLFRFVPEKDDHTLLANWKARLASFNVTYARDIDALRRTPDRAAWRDGFSRIEAEFGEPLKGDPEDLRIRLSPVRERFAVEMISEEEYASALQSGRYGAPATAEMECLAVKG